MGCHAMDAVTYPQEKIEAFVDAHFVPCRLESGKHVELARRLGVRWLPGTVVLDADERPAHAQIGFLSPDDLIVELSFARAIQAMGEKRYDDAHALFAEVAARAGHERAPEAYFWWGISRYRHSKDFSSAVREPWSAIVERWPGSEWARKVGYALGKPAA
jgi:TolA-binding protein